MEEIVSDEYISWNEFRDRTVLIVGATGLIGSALVRALSAANCKYGLEVRILMLGRDRKKAKELTDIYGADFVDQDICHPFKVAGNVDYIFHCAAITKSSEMAVNPVEVIRTSLYGTDNILTLAREKKIKSMVYLSSMEVYGLTDPTLTFVTEDYLGYIDLNKTRSCYPESKRMCENLCNCWFAQYGIPVKTARLAQTFGAGVLDDDPRVYAQIARSIIEGEDIILHTDGNSRGNYCYVSDAVRGLLILLLKGQNGEAYNVVNPNASMTIREMAVMVASKFGRGDIKVVVRKPIEIERNGYAPDTTMRLSADKLERLGWNPKYGLEEMYQRLILDWREKG
jgi:Nucleoside-diphosphate-sugar epimerases